MEFESITWLVALQLRSLAHAAARENAWFEELMGNLTPLLIVCDSCDGYLYAPKERGFRIFDPTEEIVVTGESYPPTYFFETMTVARAAAYSMDMDIVFSVANRPDVLMRGAGDDTIRTSGPFRDRDWMDERNRFDPPPRDLRRESFQVKPVARYRPGWRGA